MGFGFFRDESAQASILIILIMIVLVSMGYATISAATANTRLSGLAADWNRRFFYLDGEGEKFIAHVDRLLLNAQNYTNEYFYDEAYRRFTHPDFAVEKQTFIRDNYDRTLSYEAFVEETMDMLFFFYADREFERLSEIYPGVVISTLRARHEDSGLDFVRGIICDITLNHPDSPDFHLSITLSVNSHSDFRGLQRMGNSTASRYRITSWLQWQSTAAEEATAENLWDGRIVLP